MKKLSLFGVMFALILTLSACGDKKEEESYNAVEETAPTIEITDAMINDTTAEMKKMQFVEDAAIAKQAGTVSLALIVNGALNDETAKSYADSFVRTFADYAGSRLKKDYYGEVYDEYDMFVTVADSSGNEILSGSKLHTNKDIRWK